MLLSGKMVWSGLVLSREKIFCLKVVFGQFFWGGEVSPLIEAASKDFFHCWLGGSKHPEGPREEPFFLLF